MSVASERPHVLTPDQQAKERSILFAITMDTVMVAALLATGIIGGSLTMTAEGLRGGLGYLLECFTFVLLRRIHRGVLVDMEYGAGKVEQVANMLIGASMLLASAWISFGVLRILSGQRELGTPLGLACAAIVGSVNLFVNLLAWDSVRRVVAAGEGSLIMEAQLTLRWVKLCASLVVGVGLTVAALSTDDVIVAVADGLGSAFVAGYLVLNSVSVLRTAIPDLLDRSAGREVQRVVASALATHATDYSRLLRTRSRRSGRVTFIEIALTFDSALAMNEVDRRVEALKRTIRDAVSEAEVSIVASSAPAEPPPGLVASDAASGARS